MTTPFTTKEALEIAKLVGWPANCLPPSTTSILVAFVNEAAARALEKLLDGGPWTKDAEWEIHNVIRRYRTAAAKKE